MSDKPKKTLVAAALAVVMSYGLVSQQAADSTQARANQTLSDAQFDPTPQQAPGPGTPSPGGAGPVPQDAAPGR